jgi:hypothetical protein
MDLEGTLTNISVLRLLYILQQGSHSGKLLIWSETEWALLWIVGGQVVSAVILGKMDRRPRYAGEQAVFDLFTWTDGRFSYCSDSASGSYPVTIKRPTSALIAEALERRTEGKTATAVGDSAAGSIHAGMAMLRPSPTEAMVR